MVLTFALAVSIWKTAVYAKVPKLAGVLIGVIVALETLVGGPPTGAAMSPARTFGPGLAAGVWTAHWVYWRGPITGAVFGAVVSEEVLRDKT